MSDVFQASFTNINRLSLHHCLLIPFFLLQASLARDYHKLFGAGICIWTASSMVGPALAWSIVTVKTILTSNHMQHMESYDKNVFKAF